MTVDYGEVHAGVGGAPMWKAEVEVSSDRIPSPELSSLLRHESTSKPLRNLHPASRTEDIDAARHANEALCSPAASLNETGGHGIPNMPSPQPIEKIRQPAPDTISQRQLIAEIDAMFPGELLIDDKRIDANSRLNNSQRAALIALHRALARESPSTWHAPQHAYAICDLEQPDWQDTRPAGTWWHGMTCAPRMMWYLLKSMLVFLATAPYLLSSVTALLCEGIYALFVDSVDYLEQCRLEIEENASRHQKYSRYGSRQWHSRIFDKLLAALSHFRHVAIISVLDCFREPHSSERSILYLTLSSVARNGLIAWVFFTMCIKKQDGAAVTYGNRHLALLSLKGVAVMIHTIQALYSITVYLAFLSTKAGYGVPWLTGIFLRSGKNHTKFRSRGRMFHLDGKLNGIQVEANADTGASFNVISSALAKMLGLTPEPGTGGYILLPSGRRIFSAGKVDASFRFGDEKGDYDLSCIILEKASRDLVLGSKFLRLTKTFTKHKHRLKKVFAIAPRFSLNLLGDTQEGIPGYLNGMRCFAVPDSGSDIMAISGKYAKAHGLKVRRGRRHRNVVEFIDGSRQHTDGIVKDLSWQFRENEGPIRCDFHIINNLPVDAILSNGMVDEYNVFTRYGDTLSQSHSIDDQSGIYNIRLAKKCRTEIAKLEDSFIEDMTSDTPFTPEIIDREEARRDMIRDRIDGLLEHERPEQRAKEAIRKARFDEELKKHLKRMARAAQRSQQSSTTSTQNSGTGNGKPSIGSQSGACPSTQLGSRRSRLLAWMWRVQA